MDVVWIDVDKVEFDEAANIRSMSEDEFRLLVRSIVENGYVEPIQVVEYDGGKRYRILNGFHRFKALTEVFGLKTFPVVVVGRDWEEERFLQEMVRLNNIHGEFIPEQLANVVARINSKMQFSQEELRQKLGFSTRNRLYKRLLNDLLAQLPAGVREQVKEKVKRHTSMDDALNAIKDALYGGKRLIVINGVEYGITVSVDDDVYQRLKAIDLEYGLANVLTLLVELWASVVKVLGLGE